jgi:hypothetical protein
VRTRALSYLALLKGVDLNGNFYYSPTYDVTRTLQANLTDPYGAHSLRESVRER